MLKIFLSWSGVRSKKTAEILKKYLPRFLHQIEPWMSSKDIYKGDRWAIEIGDNLDSHQIGIICITPENRTAPWILFEAGAISKQLEKSKVFPLLLGMTPEELDGPLGQFQSTVLDEDDFKKLIEAINSLLGEGTLNKDVLDATFSSFWPKMAIDLEKVTEEKIRGTAINIHNVTSVFGKYGFSEPKFGNHVYFSSGFESHHVYSSAYELAQKRIWIWGRKNRKAFDKEHKIFFENLPMKMRDEFDFRVLFLDPNSNPAILSKAHKDDDFIEQLESSIINAKKTSSQNGIDFDKISRAYSGLRNTGIVIVDDAILYSPIQYAKDGCVEPLTKAPFSIVGSESELGKDLEKIFLSCWEVSEPLNV